MMLLAIDYQYDMEQAKAGLLKKATLSEINKYSLKQLRNTIETDEKNAAPKLESKKRPKPDITAVL
jgi:hypothetical protein